MSHKVAARGALRMPSTRSRWAASFAIQLSSQLQWRMLSSPPFTYLHFFSLLLRAQKNQKKSFTLLNISVWEEDVFMCLGMTALYDQVSQSMVISIAASALSKCSGRFWEDKYLTHDWRLTFNFYFFYWNESKSRSNEDIILESTVACKLSLLNSHATLVLVWSSTES